MDILRAYLEYIGDIAVLNLMGKLDNLEDYTRKLIKSGIKYIVLSFEKIKQIYPSDTTEIMNALSISRSKKVGFYLCNLGDENQDPYKTLSKMGVTKLTGLEVRPDLEAIIQEIKAK